METTSGRRAYTLNGKPIDISAFLFNNRHDADVIERAVSLKPGESVTFGGGAAATFILERIA